MARVLAVRPDPPLVSALGTIVDLGRHQLTALDYGRPIRLR